MTAGRLPAAMHARNVMSLDPVTCESDATVAEAAGLMRDRKVGFVCVLRGGRLVGIVTDRMVATDCVAEGLDPGETPVEHIMQQPATVHEDETIFAVLDTLRSAGMVRRVPVVDDGNELVGVVSLSDLAPIAKDLLDGILAEDLHNATANARVLTGAKRIVKKIRRPGKADRLQEPPVVRKRRASRPGTQRNPIPRRRRVGEEGDSSGPTQPQGRDSWNRGR
jgi:CBS domain-containing protein